MVCDTCGKIDCNCNTINDYYKFRPYLSKNTLQFINRTKCGLCGGEHNTRDCKHSNPLIPIVLTGSTSEPSPRSLSSLPPSFTDPFTQEIRDWVARHEGENPVGELGCRTPPRPLRSAREPSGAHFGTPLAYLDESFFNPPPYEFIQESSFRTPFRSPFEDPFGRTPSARLSLQNEMLPKHIPTSRERAQTQAILGAYDALQERVMEGYAALGRAIPVEVLDAISQAKGKAIRDLESRT